MAKEATVQDVWVTPSGPVIQKPPKQQGMKNLRTLKMDDVKAMVEMDHVELGNWFKSKNCEFVGDAMEREMVSGYALTAFDDKAMEAMRFPVGVGLEFKAFMTKFNAVLRAVNRTAALWSGKQSLPQKETIQKGCCCGLCDCCCNCSCCTCVPPKTKWILPDAEYILTGSSLLIAGSKWRLDGEKTKGIYTYRGPQNLAFEEDRLRVRDSEWAWTGCCCPGVPCCGSWKELKKLTAKYTDSYDLSNIDTVKISQLDPSVCKQDPGCGAKLSDALCGYKYEWTTYYPAELEIWLVEETEPSASLWVDPKDAKNIADMIIAAKEDAQHNASVKV